MSALDIPVCPYCSKPSTLVTGAVVYPHMPELAEKPIWACMPCGAWVGCHPGGQMPLGRLADAGLRRAKKEAHNLFDPLWKAKMRRDGCSKREARGKAYAWLAGQLGIPREDCHIGMFDVATCRRVVEICRNPKRKPQPHQPDLLEDAQ
jgi:uncharacterized protein DUF3268